MVTYSSILNINVYLVNFKDRSLIDRHKHLNDIVKQMQVINYGNYVELVNSALKYNKYAEEIKTLYLRKNIAKLYIHGEFLDPLYGERTRIPSVGWYVRKFDDTYKKYEICAYNNYCYDYSISEFIKLLRGSAWVVDRWAIYPFAIIRIIKAIYKKTTYMELFSKRNKINNAKFPKSHYSDGIYFIWRRMGAFSSAVLDTKPLKNANYEKLSSIIFTRNVSFGRTSYLKVAYYYSGVLNALLKIIHDNIEKIKDFYGINNITFVRDQFLRPIIYLNKLELNWNNSTWQNHIADLSRIIHDKARRIYIKRYNLEQQLIIKGYKNAKDKLFELMDLGRDLVYHDLFKNRDVLMNINLIYNKLGEFREIVEIINDKINQNKLIKESHWILEASKK